jgi:tetratricopeptide (TPR) repeat protein
MPDPDQLRLPDAPSGSEGAVIAWEEPVTIETYEPHRPDRNPMFLESRVYQGSSGKVYPLPFIERISQECHLRQWRAVHIENEFLRVMILPELGGRIHIGLDKTNGYDFFYRQNVIKPALVGLAGPWASGGVEFNWPQHHRPATYMPVETQIERDKDGAVTVWSSDHDPFQRMKGAHGVCLHPGKAVLELKVRLYNRTELTQTFLWWANAATRVHELYQSFFPPDVHFVADHARRAMSTYPLCTGTYYGIDYGKRAANGTSAEEEPPQFVPPGTYAPNDLRWYANIPVPTSYMALGSEADFLGGYDHKQQAGVIHVANHHIAPGKKQWTWGNHEFGYSWDRQLTDADGPYIELMSGVYTDNQPDFSFLAPGETKTFSQYWYPIQRIGVANAANVRGACRVEPVGTNQLRVAFYLTEEMRGVGVVVAQVGQPAGSANFAWVGDAGPGLPVDLTLNVPSCGIPERCAVLIADGNGSEILRYSPASADASIPCSASEPPLPAEVESIEELFLIGQHLEQYRHATRDPIDYWREALRRDPGESRCHEKLGLLYLRRGEFVEAEKHLLSGVARITSFNLNPASGGVFYHLGIVRRFLGKDAEAYDALYKSTWNFDFRSAGYHALAEIDAARGRSIAAVKHLDAALRTNVDNLRARNLRAVLLRRLGQTTEAARAIAESLDLDPTDVWARYLSNGQVPRSNQALLDIVFDYWRAGLLDEAAVACAKADLQVDDGSVPIICYTLALLQDKLGHGAEAEYWRAKTHEASPEFCFPSRLEEMVVLEWTLEQNPSDERAQYYLGNLYYDRRRYEDAIHCWEAATRGRDVLPTVWRNLGIAYFNVRNDSVEAARAFDLAFALDMSDGRVLFERDQLWKRTGVAPIERLRELERYPELVRQRDDLSIELISLLNQNGHHERALELLMSRSFQPWEGGEGLVMEQHVRTHVALGRLAMLSGRYELARERFQEALESPANLGEAKHLLANRANVYFWLGEAYHRLQIPEDARVWWQKAISTEHDFQEMRVKPFSAMSFYRILSFQRLGSEADAVRLSEELRKYARALESSEPKIDYFATSLPNTLLFRENLAQEQHLLSRFLQAQVLVASGDAVQGNGVLNKILEAEPSHAAATDLLEESRCLMQLGLFRAAPASSD